MTGLKKLIFIFFLGTSFFNFSQAMEQIDEETPDENYVEIKKEWSPDGNYLYIQIDNVIWVFGPFNEPDESAHTNKAEA